MADAAEKLLHGGSQDASAAGQILTDQPLVYCVIPDDAFLWSWGLMLVFGIGVQALGLYFRRRLLMAAGAAMVCGAAVMDRDPTLFAGQILLTLGLALLTARRQKPQSPDAARKRSRKNTIKGNISIEI